MATFSICGRVLILTTLVALCGCSGSQASRGGAAPTTAASKPGFRRYDDPSYSDGERRAVRAATEAVLDPARPRPDFDTAYRYSVTKYDGDWAVTVWRVHGFSKGRPLFVPGGHTGVTLDRDFRVKSKMPGA